MCNTSVVKNENMKFLKVLRIASMYAGSMVVLSGVYASSAFAVYEKNYIGDIEEYTAVYEDTLVHLARKHDLGFVEMRAANPELDPWIPGEGAKVLLPKRHLLPDVPREGIVINLPEMRVYAYLNGDDEPYSYPIGIGREGLDTPTGQTSIVRKKEGPTWHPTQRMLDEDPELEPVVPPGPDNPLGTHALYLGWPTYAMHGTNRPFGIGRRVSSGCIRLYPEDIAKFFGQAPVGTPVNVIDQPIKVSWIGNELYLEAHPDLEQAIKMEEMGVVEQQKFTDEDMAFIIKVAGEYAELLNWPRIRSVLRERKGYPVRIARYYAEDEGSEENDVADEKDGKDEEAVAEVAEEGQEKQTTVAEEEITTVIKPKEKPEIPERGEKKVQSAIIIPPVKPALEADEDDENNT